MLFAGFCEAFCLISQEHFLKRLDSTSGASNTMKGIIGLILVIACYYPIHYFMVDIFKTEDSSDPIINLADPLFFIFCVIWIVLLCFFNFCLSSILKSSEAINACTINSGRIVII